MLSFSEIEREAAMAEARALSGKVAIVTGAGKNIGKAIALALAEDGAAVVVNGRGDRAIIEETAGEIRAGGGRAMPYLADVSKPDQVAAMVDAAVKEFGGIDIAVNNAGLRRQTPFLEMSLDEWHEILSVALDGAFILAKAMRAGDDQARRRQPDRAVGDLASRRRGRTGACQCLKGRPRRVYSRPRDGTGAARHHGQLRRARLDRYGTRPLGRGAARARRHRARHPAREAGPGRGNRFHGALPGRAGRPVRHRTDDSRQRRPVSGQVAALADTAPQGAAGSRRPAQWGRTAFRIC